MKKVNLQWETIMSLPDGPKTPAILQMLHWIINPFSFMRGCTRDYGDCFTVRLGDKFAPVVFFSHPQALQTILTSDDSKVFDAPGALNGLFEPLLGTQSVIGLSGAPHRRMRQLMMPPFHGERMRSYGQLMGNITDEVIREWIHAGYFHEGDLRSCVWFKRGTSLSATRETFGNHTQRNEWSLEC
jgi:cytochrome P450 family 110